APPSSRRSSPKQGARYHDTRHAITEWRAHLSKLEGRPLWDGQGAVEGGAQLRVQEVPACLQLPDPLADLKQLRLCRLLPLLDAAQALRDAPLPLHGGTVLLPDGCQ